MAPRPRWWHILQASKAEVRLAVDLYNRSGNERQLEAFIVHMQLGWLRLLQAQTDRTGGDMLERDDRNWRKKHPDGGYLYKSLHTLLGEKLPAGDARSANINFFAGLRNQIEHRHEAKIAALVAGRTQAYLINYEQTLVEWFGQDHALGRELRFPMFVSTITQDAAEAVKDLRAQIPHGVLEWVQDFDAKLDPSVTGHPQFDFRVYLISHTGPKTDADAAMSFVKDEDLTDDQRAALDQVRTIVRNKLVPVEDLDTLLPNEVTEHVSAVLPAFNDHMHVQAWKHYQVRPPANAPDKTATKDQFCRYNSTFKRYVYTQAWVDYLIRHLADPQTWHDVKNWKPPAA